MSVGQRIAQKRKELGLSQEGLGAKLGVSRQAIYKWESDLALPEVEKLVTLSRLFSVSVGWLLGEEEASPLACLSEGRGLAAQESGELTPQQTRMVQEIADRYIAALRAPELDGAPPVRHRRWPLGLACAVMVAALAVVLIQLGGLRLRYDQLQSGLEHTQQSMDALAGQVDGLVQNAEASDPDLEALRATLSSNPFAELYSFDPVAETLVFRIYVPEDFNPGKISFLAKAQWDQGETPLLLGPAEEGQLPIPLTDQATLSLEAVLPDGWHEPVASVSFYNLIDRTFSDAALLFPSQLLNDAGEDGILPERQLVLSCPRWRFFSSEYESHAPSETYRVGLFQDQKLMTWYEELEPDLSPSSEHSRSYSRPALVLEPGHVYCEAVVITQEGGREWVRWSDPVSFSRNSGRWAAADVFYSHAPEDWSY